MPHVTLQFARGTTTTHSAYTGQAGEITIDSTKWTAVVHDNATAGGHPLSKEGHTHTNSDVSGVKYQTVRLNGASQTQRARLGFSSLFSISDSSGDDETAVTLVDSGVTAATYGSASAVPQIAVDAKGRITSASNLTVAPFPTQTGNDGSFLRTDGSAVAWSPVVTAPAYGSAPAAAAANTGSLVLPGTGFGARRSSGSAYEKYGPLAKMTHPVFGSFAWVNQGANATAVDSLGVVMLDSVTGEASESVRMMTMSLSGAPWKVTGAFYPYLINNTTSAEVGLIIRDSGTAKFICHGVGFASGVIEPVIRKFDNATTENAAYTPTKYAMAPGQLIWMQIEDDGANRITRLSFPGGGIGWMDIHSVTNSDFLASRNQYGFYVDCRAGSKRCALALVSLVVE